MNLFDRILITAVILALVANLLVHHFAKPKGLASALGQFGRKWWVKSKSAWAWIAQAMVTLGQAIKPVEEQLQKLLGDHWFAALSTAIVLFGFYARNRTAGGLSLTNPEKRS